MPTSAQPKGVAVLMYVCVALICVSVCMHKQHYCMIYSEL